MKLTLARFRVAVGAALALGAATAALPAHAGYSTCSGTWSCETPTVYGRYLVFSGWSDPGGRLLSCRIYQASSYVTIGSLNVTRGSCRSTVLGGYGGYRMRVTGYGGVRASVRSDGTGYWPIQPGFPSARQDKA